MVADIVGAIDCRISAQRAQNAAAEHLIAVPIRAAGGDIGGGSENLAVAVTVSNGEPRVSDCMGTLDSARESRGSNQQRFVMQPVPFRKSKLAQSTTDDESWVEAEQANTLNAFDTGERDTHAVAFKPGQSAAARSMGAQEEVACTLEGGGGGNNRQAVAIGTDMYNHAITGDVAATMGTPGSSVNASGPTVMQAHGFYSTDGSHGVNQQPEVSPAVKVGSGLGIPSPPAVAHALRGEGFDASEDGTGRGTPIIPVAHAIGFIPKAPPNSRSMGEEVENGPTVTTHMMGQGVSLSLPMTVRRLTPRECERLQAFPDDYTLIPWRKKPADQCPDGPRYKALGNSMAVNCMEWIGERIAAYEAKERKQ
jgi:site-specific DNA-cytosine methylase